MSKKSVFTFLVIILIFTTVNRLLAVPTPIDQNNEKDRNEFLTNFLSLSASSLLKGDQNDTDHIEIIKDRSLPVSIEGTALKEKDEILKNDDFQRQRIISPRFNPSRNSQREEIKNLKKTKNVNPEEDDLGPPPLPPLRETEFFRTRFKTSTDTLARDPKSTDALSKRKDEQAGVIGGVVGGVVGAVGFIISKKIILVAVLLAVLLAMSLTGI